MACVTYHLDLHQCFVAVIQEVARFAAVDPHDTEKKLTTESQGHRRLARGDDGLDTLSQVRLEDVRLRELALEVGGQPDPGEGPGPLEECLRVEHDDWV